LPDHRRLPRAIPALLGAVLTLAAGVARAEVVIAVAGPFSGNLAVLGEEMKAGAEQAVADINNAGGVNGETVRLEEMDDACDAKTADAVANQLAGKGVAMVVGHLCLAASIAASTVYATNEIIEISPATTYPKYTDERPGPGIFRLAGRDDQQGLVAGKFLAAHYPDKNIAIVDDNSAYGKGLADTARRAMNAAGKKEAFTATYQPDADDFSDLVFRMKASSIDVVYIGGSYPDVARIAREMRKQTMSTTIVGGDALMTEEYWKAAGDAAQGTLVTFPPDPRKSPDAADVVHEFRARGVEPEGYVLNSYAAVQIWSEAVAAAGSTAFNDVVQALSEGRFKSVLGEVSFDGKGDVNLPGFVFYQWRDGAYDGLQM
jgi:branched-chain amino acid transport system substrate-binding protein